ncbi:MAG: TonB family protein [Cyclobacteriaceae bacterium]|nr:TonB family protein [Cyclobacteriaceae bacterium]UYN86584.1 MAG: TonB family protein [Cyclobacteriaceae bacterium]
MNDYSNDIARYLNGTMSSAERHAFEKKILSDPFLAEALEGAEQLPVEEFTEDVRGLNEELVQPEYAEYTDYAAAPAGMASKSAAAPREARAEIQSSPRTNRWIFFSRIAAGIVVVMVSGYLIWRSTQAIEKPSGLALDKTESAPAPSEESPVALPDEGNVEKDLSSAKTGEAVRQQSTATTPTPPKRKATEEAEAIQAELDDQIKTQPVLSEVKPVDMAPKLELKKEELAATEAPTAVKRDISERKKADANPLAGPSYLIPNTIRGRVTSKEDGSPLPGVNVFIKGSTTGTITDANGEYQIEFSGNTPTLVYSFIGMQSAEVSAGDRKQVDVSMGVDAAQLSEVVVTGYGFSRSEPYAPTVNMAHPENGMRNFRQYLEKNIRYPEEAKANKTQGRVTLEFFIETDGKLTDFTVIKGIGSGCDEELIRLVKEGPKWVPTKKDNTPIRDKVRVRLKFDLPK